MIVLPCYSWKEKIAPTQRPILSLQPFCRHDLHSVLSLNASYWALANTTLRYSHTKAKDRGNIWCLISRERSGVQTLTHELRGHELALRLFHRSAWTCVCLDGGVNRGLHQNNAAYVRRKLDLVQLFLQWQHDFIHKSVPPAGQTRSYFIVSSMHETTHQHHRSP